MSINIKKRKPHQMNRALEQLRRQIDELNPGDQLPSERALTQELEVSRVTLRTALQRLKQEGLIHSLPGKGIYKSEEEKENDSVKEKNIVLGLSSFSYYNTEIVETVLQDAHRHGLKVITHLNSRDDDEHREYLKSLISNTDIKGIIMNPPFYEKSALKLRDTFNNLERSGIHLVLINAFGLRIGFDSVGFDDQTGILVVTRHLMALGHEKIAFLSTEHADSTRILKRYEGYSKALKKSDRQYPEYIIKLYENNGQVRFSQDPVALIRKQRITAFVTANENVGAHLWRNLNEKGIQVPEDISIVSHDRLENVSYSLPISLTSTLRDRRLLARNAFDLLISRIIAGDIIEKETRYIDLPVEFFLGESSAKPNKNISCKRKRN